MKCRICECSELDACADGCFWAERDLCSTCAEIIAALLLYSGYAGPHETRGKNDKVLFERVAAEAARIGAEDPAEQPLIQLASGGL